MSEGLWLDYASVRPFARIMKVGLATDIYMDIPRAGYVLELFQGKYFMGNLLKNLIVLAAIIVLIAAGVFVWGYQNYDETAADGWSKTVRESLYSDINQNEPRRTLAPDLDPEIPSADPSFSYGLKGDYQFTTDWFSKKSPAWSVVLKDLVGKPNLRYLEVGVYEGRSVVWMLENVLTHPTSTVTGLDIFWAYDAKEYEYSPELQKLYEDNVIAAGGEGRFTTIVGLSQETLREQPLGYYDVIYIDGAHNGPEVLEDAILAWRLLKMGGVLIFDDYRWWPIASRISTPRYAIDIFAEALADNFDYVHSEGQAIFIRKDATVRTRAD
jgi:predicted O-methyltransferase YrrM